MKKLIAALLLVPVTALAAQTDLGRIAMDSDLQDIRDVVTSWEYAIGGSNVVMSVTNYESGVYHAEVPKLVIKELRGGEYRQIYDSQMDSHTVIQAELESFKTNTLVNPTNGVVTQVNIVSQEVIAVYQELMDVKADKAWGKYTSAGETAPSNTVVITEPYTEFMGGTEFKRVVVGTGAIGVLVDRGAPVYTQGDEGTFKITDAGGTNWFGFATTQSYVLPCNTDGITVGAGNLVTLTYNVTMSGHPTIWYTETLDRAPGQETITWRELKSEGTLPVVSWETSPPTGQQICYISTPSQPSGFYKATVEQTGSSKFMTNMPADFLAGILCTNTTSGRVGIIKPTFNGTSVSWNYTDLND